MQIYSDHILCILKCVLSMDVNANSCTLQQSLENIKCLPLFSLIVWSPLRSKQVH